MKKVTLFLRLSLPISSTCAFLVDPNRRHHRQAPPALYFEMPEYKDGTEYAMNNRDINNILEQNKAYVDALGAEFFEGLGAKNEPKYMWIGCSDARAPANELMVSAPYDYYYY